MATDASFDEEALPQMRALHHFALQLCRDNQYSKDLVQETMLKAYTYRDSYREGTNCRAWLFQICKNSYINEAKRRKQKPLSADLQEGEAFDPRGGIGGQAGNPRLVTLARHCEYLEDEILSDEVATAVDSLPPDYQTVVLLCDIEGYSYDEIAVFMNAPVGTIRSRIHRGRKMLAMRLRDYAHQQGYTTPVAPRRGCRIH